MSRSLRDWQYDSHQAHLVFDGSTAVLRVHCPHGADTPMDDRAESELPPCRRDEDGGASSECEVHSVFVEFCDDELWDSEETGGFAPRVNPFPIAWRVDREGVWVKPAHPELSGAPCPTECDNDCDVACHESHQVAFKRLHPVGEHPTPDDLPEAHRALMAHAMQLQQRLADAEASRTRMLEELAFAETERQRATSYWNLAAAKNMELSAELEALRPSDAPGANDD